MLRICIVIARGQVTDSPRFGVEGTGGATLYAVRLARALAQAGASVDLVTRRGEADPEERIGPRVRVVRVPCRASPDAGPGDVWCQMPELAERVRRRGARYDVVVSHNHDGGLAGAMLARELAVPHIHVPHTLERLESGPEAWLSDRARLEQQVMATADAVVVPGEQLRHELRRAYDVRASAVHVIAPGVDDATVRPRRRLAPGAVVAVSRGSSARGLDLLIEAAALLPSFLTFHLYLAGTSLDEDEDAVHVRRLIAEHGLERKITVLGALPHRLVPALLEAAEIFVNPSRYHAYGVATLEAMAAGAPAILSTGVGSSHLIESGVTGEIVPAGDPVALADRIAEFLLDPERRTAMGAAARATIAPSSRWPAVARRMLGLVDERAATAVSAS